MLVLAMVVSLGTATFCCSFTFLFFSGSGPPPTAPKLDKVSSNENRGRRSSSATKEEPELWVSALGATAAAEDVK